MTDLFNGGSIPKMRICIDCKHCIKPSGWTSEKELTSNNEQDLARCSLLIDIPEKVEVHLVTGDLERIPAKFGFCFDNRYNGECGKLGNYYEPLGDVEIPPPGESDIVD